MASDPIAVAKLMTLAVTAATTPFVISNSAGVSINGINNVTNPIPKYNTDSVKNTTNHPKNIQNVANRPATKY